MADGILGLGSGQASTLNQELIDKLKDAERKSTVEPIENRLDAITRVASEDGETSDGEALKLAAITAKANELLEAVEPFYQFTSSGTTVFDLKSANTTGTSVVFDAASESSLNTGSTIVKVDQLATRDVYQSVLINSANLENDINDGELTIAIAGDDGLFSESYTFDTTNKNYKELVTEINFNANITASLEKVSDDSYRIVIKSANSGEANALKISQSTSQSLGFGTTSTSANSYTSTDIPVAGSIVIDGETFTLDGTTESYQDLATKIDASATFNASYENDKLIISRVDGAEVSVTQDDFNFGLASSKNGQTIQAQNLNATVNGVEYDISSNVITVDGGLKITAVEANDPNDPNDYSTISIEEDSTYVETYLQNFVNKYNELVELVNVELYSADSPMRDTDSLRTMMESIKDKIFKNYGENGEFNIFNLGLDLDKSGTLSVDTERLNEVIADDYESLKSLFFDSYGKDANGESQTIMGLGSELKEYIDALDGFDGILYTYEERLTERQETLEEEKEKAEKALESKYSLLAQQFASYSTIITQMESSFSGLSLMIKQSIASN